MLFLYGTVIGMNLYSVPVLYTEISNSFLLGPLGFVLAWGVLYPSALFPFTLRSCCCWVFPLFLTELWGFSFSIVCVSRAPLGTGFAGFLGISSFQSSSQYLFRSFLGLLASLVPSSSSYPPLRLRNHARSRSPAGSPRVGPMVRFFP